MKRIRLLVIEDQAIVARDLCNRLQTLGYEIVGTAANADEALDLVAREKPDLVLMDIHLPGGRDGIDAATLIRDIHHIPAVFVTAYAEESTLQRAKAAKPYGYIIKPFEDHELRATIEVAVHQHGMEDRLRRSEESFRLLYEGMTQGVAFHDASGLLVDCNPAAERLLGISGADLQHRSFQDPRWQNVREDGSPLPGAEHPTLVALSTGRAVHDFVLGIRNSRLDQRRWLSITAVPQFRPGESSPWRVFSTLQDITESKQLGLALRESEGRYRQLVESTPDAILVHVEGRIAFVNPAAVHLFGARSAKDLLGRLAFEFLEPAGRAEAINRDALVSLGTRDAMHEARVLRVDGTLTDVETISVPLVFEGKPAIQMTIRDISWRKQAEAALRASESSYRGLFNTVRLAIYIQNAEGRFLDVNDGAVAMYGYSREEFIDRTPEFLAAPGRNDLAAVAGRIRHAFEGEPQQFEFWGRRKNGEIFPKDVRICRGTYFGQAALIAIAADITEAKRLEAQLLQSSKMEAIGRLAGGVAHDFNNILAAMLLQLGLLKMNLDGHAAALEELSELDAIAERGTALIRQLLIFGRRGNVDFAQIQLAKAVADLLNMVRRLLGETIVLAFEPQPDLPEVQADPALVQQVLLNLCVNGRDAMPNGGSLVIRLSAESFDDTRAAQHPGALTGNFVALAVRDNGIGLDETTRQHLFEPFYTTKGPGKGTGLGLATVLSVVQQHKGWIEVDSEPGHGTEFRAYFPVATRVPSATNPAPSPFRPTPPARGGTETLLLVEDNDSLRRSLCAYLRQLGYTILDAPDAPSAIALRESDPRPLDLLVTDMVMPGGINGLELVRRLRTAQPALPAIVISGYSADLEDGGTLGHNVVFLAKPFPPHQLATQIRQYLDGEIAALPALPAPTPGRFPTA